MENQIILYENQTVECFIFSSESFKTEEEIAFKTNDNLNWDVFSNAKIICNFEEGLASSYLGGITDKITGYEIFKKKTGEDVMKSLGIFSFRDLEKTRSEENLFSLIDYNVNNNTEYTYSISPLTEDYAQATLESKILVNWDVFSLTPIYKLKNNQYSVVKDDLGQPINWIFQLNCSEGDITLNQDKTIFTTFASKPKISLGDLSYYTGNFSCLLGNVLYNDRYYEPNILLDKWNKMVKQDYVYLFKNAKGDSMIVSLEDGTKRKYMNEVSNYYKENYNMDTVITNRPTTIEFSYMEIMEAQDIIVYGV